MEFPEFINKEPKTKMFYFLSLRKYSTGRCKLEYAETELPSPTFDHLMSDLRCGMALGREGLKISTSDSDTGPQS